MILDYPPVFFTIRRTIRAIPIPLVLPSSDTSGIKVAKCPRSSVTAMFGLTGPNPLEADGTQTPLMSSVSRKLA